MPSIDRARILIMATDGFEESELFGPRAILQARGAEVLLASPNLTRIQATVRDDPGKTIRPDLTIADAKVQDFNALVLPGGVINPDALRIQPKAVAFAKAFFDAGKPVAAICHGPWTVIETGAARGRRMTSWPSLKTDLKNAGADWVHQEALVDKGLVTSRDPNDIPAFNRETIKLFSGARWRRHAA